MKRYSGLLIYLLTLSVIAGLLLSKVPLIGRLAMHLKAYSQYTFLKTWWKAGLFVFVVLAVLLSLHHLVSKWYKGRKATVIHVIALILAILGLYYTYTDFRHEFSHKIMKERFHLGAYLLWIGWISICLFFLKDSSKKR